VSVSEGSIARENLVPIGSQVREYFDWMQAITILFLGDASLLYKSSLLPFIYESELIKFISSG